MKITTPELHQKVIMYPALTLDGFIADMPISSTKVVAQGKENTEGIISPIFFNARYKQYKTFFEGARA